MDDEIAEDNPAVPSAGCGKARTLQDGNQTIASGGMNRTYLLETPDAYDNTYPHRVVFMFHWNYGSIQRSAMRRMYTGGSWMQEAGLATREQEGAEGRRVGVLPGQDRGGFALHFGSGNREIVGVQYEKPIAPGRHPQSAVGPSRQLRIGPRQASVAVEANVGDDGQGIDAVR